MSGFVDLLVRLIAIFFAYLCAALAASLFLHLAGWSLLDLRPEDAPWVMLGSAFVSVPFVALFAAWYGFISSAIVIAITEFARLRGFVVQALGGAIVGLSVALRFGVWRGGGVAYRTPDASFAPERIDVLSMLVAAGIAGALVYWAIAGRNAGRWIDRRASLARRDGPPTSPAR